MQLMHRIFYMHVHQQSPIYSSDVLSMYVSLYRLNYKSKNTKYT